MSVALTYSANVSVTETLEANVPAALAANAQVVHNQFNTTKSLTGATTPPVTKVAAFEKALVAGSGTIDLTALVGTNGAAVDLTGLKVQAIKFKAKTANTAIITVEVGATNGYTGLGGMFSVGLLPGQEFAFYGHDASADVDSGVKTFDLTGTGTDALQVIVVAG